MIKTKASSIEEYIEHRKSENNGNPSKLIGSNGFRMDLTVENYNRLKEICLQRHEDNQRKNKKLS